jgi:hypothetical protein
MIRRLITAVLAGATACLMTALAGLPPLPHELPGFPPATALAANSSPAPEKADVRITPTTPVAFTAAGAPVMARPVHLTKADAALANTGTTYAAVCVQDGGVESGDAGGRSFELAGYVYFDADADGMREPDGNESFVSEYGLKGVVLHLTGTTTDGQAVDQWATTDAAGYYAFGNMAAGTYTITRGANPTGFFDGPNHVGSLGGTSRESHSDPAFADAILDIVLGGGASGTDYNFGMLEGGGTPG